MTISAPYIALEVIIAVLSIVGNVLVCWAVAINSTLKNATNYFLVSLAVADIAVGLLAIPFAITISIGFETDFHSCLFFACFVLVLTQSSIFSLLAVAIDRYLAIKIPLRYKSLVTGKRARAVIAVFWILSFVMGLTPLMGWNCMEGDCGSNETISGRNRTVSCLFEKVVTMTYMVYFNFFGCVLLPLLIMLGIYIKIFMVARKQLRQIELKCVGADTSRTTLQKEVNAAKSLSIIVGLFAFCWLPIHILNCITLFDPEFHKRKPEWVMNVAIILSHANSVVNPIIYAYKIRDFRYTFRKIISKNLLCKKDNFSKFPNGSIGQARQTHISSVSAANVFM
ncbi:PREDICTED: adenosine receptor A2b [Nanorana parkeri]|uniref:adenosine receptor A2b n=1 Tax=Nanorana parkeri TaxID=125878 RepID=UPI000853F9DD|nr:PREDICTED: adenosine receptor A2b [Nanorana parkeri]